MTPFGKLFWGLLLVLLDFTINGFDILVDLVGYILVVVGLGELASRNRNFQRARPFGIVLLALSVLDLFTQRPSGREADVDVGLFGSAALAVIFSVGLLIVNLLLVYYICSGIADMARGIGDAELAHTAMRRWQVYLWAQVAAVLLLVFVFANPSAVGLIILVIAANLIAAVLVAALLRRSDKAFYPAGA